MRNKAVFTVDEIMSVGVQTLHQSDNLADARQLMAKNGIHHLPIVDDAGDLVGLVSHRDVLAASDSSLASESADKTPGKVVIEQFMTKNVTTVDGRASAKTSIRLSTGRNRRETQRHYYR